MEFSTILTIILVGYAIYYLINIIKDLRAPDNSYSVKGDEDDEDIDISDENGFQPVEVNDEKKNSSQHENEWEGGSSMSGGIKVKDLISKVEELVQQEENSELANISSCWSFA